MAIELFSIEWQSEDKLPEMTDLEYDLCYQQSKVVNEVRMFPFIRDWDQVKDRERVVFLGA